MKRLLSLAATLLLTQHALASEDYFCVIKSSRTSIAQAAAGAINPNVDTNLHIQPLKGVSSGNSFIASLVHDEATQSQVLDIAINYAVGNSSYQFEERLYREFNIQGSRGFITKGSDENSKIPLIKSTKTNLMSNRSFGSIKKNNSGFVGNLRLELDTNNENSYSQIIKFECLRAYKVLN